MSSPCLKEAQLEYDQCIYNRPYDLNKEIACTIAKQQLLFFCIRNEKENKLEHTAKPLAVYITNVTTARNTTTDPTIRSHFRN